jgi:hypothetical protein
LMMRSRFFVKVEISRAAALIESWDIRSKDTRAMGTSG